MSYFLDSKKISSLIIAITFGDVLKLRGEIRQNYTVVILKIEKIFFARLYPYAWLIFAGPTLAVVMMRVWDRYMISFFFFFVAVVDRCCKKTCPSVFYCGLLCNFHTFGPREMSVPMYRCMKFTIYMYLRAKSILTMFDANCECLHCESSCTNWKCQWKKNEWQKTTWLLLRAKTAEFSI